MATSQAQQHARGVLAQAVTAAYRTFLAAHRVARAAVLRGHLFDIDASLIYMPCNSLPSNVRSLLCIEICTEYIAQQTALLQLQAVSSLLI